MGRMEDRRDGTIVELCFWRDVLKTSAEILSVKPLVKEHLELNCAARPKEDLLDGKVLFNGIPYSIEFKSRQDKYKHFSLLEDYRVVAALKQSPALMIEYTPSGYSYADFAHMINVPANVWFYSYRGAAPNKQWMWHRRWPCGSFRDGFFFDLPADGNDGSAGDFTMCDCGA